MVLRAERTAVRSAFLAKDSPTRPARQVETHRPPLEKGDGPVATSRGVFATVWPAGTEKAASATVAAGDGTSVSGRAAVRGRRAGRCLRRRATRTSAPRPAAAPGRDRGRRCVGHRRRLGCDRHPDRDRSHVVGSDSPGDGRPRRSDRVTGQRHGCHRTPHRGSCRAARRARHIAARRARHTAARRARHIAARRARHIARRRTAEPTGNGRGGGRAATPGPPHAAAAQARAAEGCLCWPVCACATLAPALTVCAGCNLAPATPSRRVLIVRLTASEGPAPQPSSTPMAVRGCACMLRAAEVSAVVRQ